MDKTSTTLNAAVHDDDHEYLVEATRGMSKYALSLATFGMELPSLMQECAGRWVAYDGDLRLGTYRLKREAIAASLDRHVPERDVFVRCVEPPIDADPGSEPARWS